MNRSTRRPARADGGFALVGAMAVLVALFGVSAAYMTLSMGAFDTSTREIELVHARIDAERGLNLAIAELASDVDADADGLGNVSTANPKGGTLLVTATDLGGDVWRLKSVARLPRANAAAEAVVEVVSSAPNMLQFPPRAAITSNGSVSVTGSIVVDGRNWNEFGTSVVGPGNFGISSCALITNSGNAAVGGKGLAPAKPPPLGTTEPLASWNNMVDDDADGYQGEEPFDGVDNDGDGKIDEDTVGYPTCPDSVVGLPSGSLKSFAISQGTYFNTQAGIDAYIAANGGELPGGKIVYCEFDMWLPVNLGSGLNAEPSIIVNHNAAGNAVMKNVHGAFKGLILSDLVTHLNGDFVLVGALMSFAPATYGNAYGNGNAMVKLSTAAVGNLPAATAPAAKVVKVRSWSRSSVE